MSNDFITGLGVDEQGRELVFTQIGTLINDEEWLIVGNNGVTKLHPRLIDTIESEYKSFCHQHNIGGCES